jgi:hypothetical protein
VNLWNFSQKVRTPLKFKQDSNWNLFWKLYFKIKRELEARPKRKLVPFELIYNNTNFGNLWTS